MKQYPKYFQFEDWDVFKLEDEIWENILKKCKAKQISKEVYEHLKD